MTGIRCNIDGVVIRHLKKNIDPRGWLTELFRRDELPTEFQPVMSYVSETKPGSARGPHEHREQTDYFCFVGPSAFRVYLWDNRSESSTYGNKCRFEVGGEDIVSVMIPPGVVHAYENIGTIGGIVFNAPDRLYAGEGRKGPPDEIRYEDDESSKFRLDD